jgi:hypothetical protein
MTSTRYRVGCGRAGCRKCNVANIANNPCAAINRHEQQQLNTSSNTLLKTLQNGNQNAFNQQELLPTQQQQRHKTALDATEALLLEHSLERVPIPADGNCMFHAIAAFFHNRAVTHLSVRRMIVDYIERNPDKFRIDIECDWPSLEQYCREMRMPRTWGDATALSAFCMANNVNIVVFGERGFSELYPGNDRIKLALVRVADHYDATRVLTRRQKEQRSSVVGIY